MCEIYFRFWRRIGTIGVMHIALYRPEIPPNTGNIARLCVLTGSPLHIVGAAAFSLDEKAVRRAGLDYWDLLELHQHADWEAFESWFGSRNSEGRLLLLSKHGSRRYTDHSFHRDDVLLFGSETSGVPSEIHDWFARNSPETLLNIPMINLQRSQNLSNAAAIVLYEGLRQLDFEF